MTNFNTKINLIWQIAETLRGLYRPEKYGDVILPMCVLRRFDCILEDKKEAVIALHSEYKDFPEESIEELMLIDMEDQLGIQQKFFNISPYTFQKLLDDPENIKDNFNQYLNGFSSGVRDIIQHFDFRKELDKLQQGHALYNTIKEFEKVDFHPDTVTNQEMGYIFEELIRRFKENAEAGDHYTPREVIRLCMELLFDRREDTISIPGKIHTVADFCAGTGGMLSVGERYIREQNPDAIVELYGQEVNSEAYAICKADMLIKGQQPDNIVLGNSLTQDGHRGKHYRYLISNPPFGVQWKKEEPFVRTEHDKEGFHGRFGPGLPRVSDGSFLFLLNMMHKMHQDEEGSRLAIIFNGSPLFTGDAGSGESNIRRWIIENDMLEGIIAMPTDLFYNTGIATYIWVITNRKSPKRQGKIQMVNSVSFFKPMRKSLGNKRKEISPEQILNIKAIYTAFEEGKYCKIFDNEEFGFRKITVGRPLRLRFQVTEDNLRVFAETTAFQSLSVSNKRKPEEKTLEEQKGREQQEQLLKLLQSFPAEEVWMNRESFLKALKQKAKDHHVDFLKGALLKTLWQTIGQRDDAADMCLDTKGNIEPDTSLRDTETIPLTEDIQAYFQREVKPHVPDAWMDETTFDKIGYEIPFTRHFYEYKPLRPFEEIMAEVRELEQEILHDIREVLGE